MTVYKKTVQNLDIKDAHHRLYHQQLQVSLCMALSVPCDNESQKRWLIRKANVPAYNRSKALAWEEVNLERNWILNKEYNQDIQALWGTCEVRGGPPLYHMDFETCCIVMDIDAESLRAIVKALLKGLSYQSIVDGTYQHQTLIGELFKDITSIHNTSVIELIKKLKISSKL